MSAIMALLADPAAWAALLTLIVMEVVLGIDNLVFVSILTNRLPEEQRPSGRRIGLILALVMRLGLLGAIAWIVGLQATVFAIPFTAPLGEHGEPTFDLAFSARDLILIAGGLFLVWKATREIHHTVDPRHGADPLAPDEQKGGARMGFAAAIGQIILLDLVFSIDSILTAVGMTDQLPIMYAAVIVSVSMMLIASGPLARFINDNPTVVMLALGFLLMIGTILIADGFGVHVPKGYIYAAMAFSAFVEGLQMMRRRSEANSPAH